MDSFVQKKIAEESIPWSEILHIFLGSRLIVFLFVSLGYLSEKSFLSLSGGWHGVDCPWLAPWTFWDGEWFLRIAQHGYDRFSTAFFPLYPWLLSLAGPSQTAESLWGLGISNVCFFFALVFLFRLTALEHGPAIARRAVWLLAFFPVTFFFSALYTESLFLLLSVAAFYYIRKKRWGFAGILAGLAGLTRNSGGILFVMLVIEYCQSARKEKGPVRWADLLGLCLPLIAFLTVLVFFSRSFHDSSVVINCQARFFRAWSWPWTPLGREISAFTNPLLHPRTDLFASLAIIFEFLDFWTVLFAIILLIHGQSITPISYAFYILAILSMHLFHSRYIPPYTAGTMRYMAGTFPFIQLCALGSIPIDMKRDNKISLAVFYIFLCALGAYLGGTCFFLG
jgi:hypothetical protein